MASPSERLAAQTPRARDEAMPGAAETHIVFAEHPRVLPGSVEEPVSAIYQATEWPDPPCRWEFWLGKDAL